MVGKLEQYINLNNNSSPQPMWNIIIIVFFIILIVLFLHLIFRWFRIYSKGRAGASPPKEPEIKLKKIPTPKFKLMVGGIYLVLEHSDDEAGSGLKIFKDILRTGKAYEKMKKIIEAQGGDSTLSPEDINLGPHVKEFFSPKEGYIVDVNNSIINRIAKTAGCPSSKTSGIEIIKKQGAKIKEGELVFRIYSHSESKLRKAEKIYNLTGGPIRLGGMVIERI